MVGRRGRFAVIAALSGWAVPGIAEAAKGDSAGLFEDVTVLARGGVAGLTGGLGATTGLGPLWGVVVDTQPFKVLSFEVAYDGAHFPGEPGFGRRAAPVWRNAVSGLVKLEAPVGPTEPFIGAGVGISYWNPGNDVATELPVAAGLDVGAGPVTAGIRGTIQGLIGTNFTGSNITQRSGSLVTASLQLGGVFF